LFVTWTSSTPAVQPTASKQSRLRQHAARWGQTDVRAFTAHAQRKPKKPNTNKMITTAPTIQMILFMMRLLRWIETGEAGPVWALQVAKLCSF